MSVPDGVKRACRKGVEQVEEGLGGDGLEPATIKEARALARGEMPTEGKIRKANRWWARNERFLEAEPDTPADVSANLWGGPAGRDWFRKLYDDLEASKESSLTSELSMDAVQALFKAAGSITDNMIEVVASTVGNMDRSGDVIAPGAFKSAVLRDFVGNGAILAAHEWDDEPIGMPLSATVEGDKIISRAQFHTTEKGQTYRTIAKERMQAGKSVSVSVGFMPDYDSCHWFESGKALLQFAEEAGYDMPLFDSKAISKVGSCRLIRSVSELFEWSIVLVGMNPKAKAREIKDFSDASMSLEQHLELSLAGVQRALDVAQLRRQDGRNLPEPRLVKIKNIRDLADQVLTSINGNDEMELARREQLKARVDATLKALGAL
jgi:hypothetical protein